MEDIRYPVYINPLPLPSLPRGTDKGVAGMDGLPVRDYRSVSDPSVMLWDGKWYMYPSYGMTYVSEDFVSWRYEPCNIPCEPGYSPTVVRTAGKFWMTRHSDGLYSSETPTGPFEYVGDFMLPGGGRLRPVDPALFRDDDGRIYMYYFGCEGNPQNGGSSFTLGVRLDENDPQRVLTEPVILNRFDPSHVWERFGADCQDSRWGWIEGQWMLKHGGRYYLIYAANGTQFPGYSMGAYYSDEGPLSGFVYQKRNPIIGSRQGLIRGGGHGCVAHAPDGSLWAFYTIPVAYNHEFERRIGMDRMEIDENGEIWCPGMTGTPQYGPCQPEKGDAGLVPLTFFQRFSCRASSQTDGHEAFYALDDSMLTHWLPEEGDPRPELVVDAEAVYDIAACRIIWRDVGLDYAGGALPGPFRYDVSVSLDMKEWKVVLDMSGSADDLNVDCRAFPAAAGRYIRLRVYGSPQGVRPGVVSFTAFGRRETEEEEKARLSGG